MDDDRHGGIGRIVAACERWIAELAPLDNPAQRDLLADVVEVRDRLRAELDQP